jgi:hypothetical protein
VERIVKSLSGNVTVGFRSLTTENDHYLMLSVVNNPTAFVPAAISSPLLPPRPSLIISQEMLDDMLSNFGELQANHQLTLKFFLFQK